MSPFSTFFVLSNFEQKAINYYVVSCFTRNLFLSNCISRKSAICNVKMPPPEDVTGVRKFLGFVGYYRKFIPRYSCRAITQCMVVCLTRGCLF